MWQRGRRRRRRQQGGGGPASPELGTLPPSSSPADPLLPALASTRLVAFRSYFDTGSQLRQPRGVRFEHVRPSIQGGGRQAGQGHWHEDPERTGGRRATNQGSCGTGHRVCKHDEEKSLPKEAERPTFIPAPQEHRGLQNFTRMEGGR